MIALPQRSRNAKQQVRVAELVQPQQIVPVASSFVDPSVVVVNSSRSAKNRKRRQRQRANKLAAKTQELGLTPYVQISPNNPLQNPLMPQALGVSTSKQNLVRSRNNLLRGAKISPEGLRFLKCAFSSADFDGSGTYGVPDDFAGRSSAIKHRGVFSQTFTASTDYYYLLCPTPGIAYYLLTKAAGAPPNAGDIWRAVEYSDYDSIFGTGIPSSQNATKFRYVSNHFELTPTTNANSWTGNIQVSKIPIQVAMSQDPGNTANRLTITGLQAVNATNMDMYSGPFNLGSYVGAFNKDANSWDFSDVWPDQPSLPSTPSSGDFGTLSNALSNTIPGFDNNFESVLIKVSGIGSNANNTALLRTWACVEYQFAPGSVMYEMQNLKSTEDKVAMMLYRKIILELPTAVSFLDNANFWTRVLNIIKQITGVLSLVPGPYGMVAGGVNTVATGIEYLL